MPKNKKSKNTGVINSKQDLFENTETDPGFVRKLFVYSTLALLWLVTIFGLIFIPVIVQLGSDHSYYKEKIDAEFWVYLYVLIAFYTLIMTVYLGLMGYQARYLVIGIINAVMLAAFIMSTFISFFLIFYTTA